MLTSKVVERSFVAHCDAAAGMATRLGLGPDVDVVDALRQLFERWDGKGTPHKLSGAALAPAVRSLHLADVVEVYERLGGPAAAVAVARERSGGMFDSDLVDSFCANHEALLVDLDESSWDEVIGSDPALGQPLADDELDEALASLGDYADLKSPWWAGHSRGVAGLAAEAATGLGLPEATVRDVRRAGFVHDIGVIGVSNAVWDQPGPLGSTDRERVRTHPYLTERTLARSPGLAPIGQLAAMHHERLDGSGYPARLAGDAISRPARVLAVAARWRCSCTWPGVRGTGRSQPRWGSRPRRCRPTSSASTSRLVSRRGPAPPCSPCVTVCSRWRMPERRAIARCGRCEGGVQRAA